MANKPIKRLPMFAPDKDTQTSPETFAKFQMIPEYKAMLRTYPDCDIDIYIRLNENTVGVDYFEKAEKVIYWECHELLSKYTLFVS